MPYWPEAEDWTGFLMVIVPVGPLPVPAEDLRRRVRAQIETDPVLYDLVTVGLAKPLEPTAGWSRTLLTGVAQAAMADGHFFAPRGLIGIVAVSADGDAVQNAYDGFRRVPSADQLWVAPFGLTVRPDSRTGVSPDSIEKLVHTVNALVEMFDEHPQVATAESVFLDRVRALTGDHPGRTTAPPPEPPTEPARSRPSRRLEESAPIRELPSPAAPASPSPASPSPASPSPARELVKPVMYEGAEIVTVDERTPVQRLRRQHVTDADCLAELQRDGRTVGLVHLVFVPDDGAVMRAVAKRRNAIALELDQAFSAVHGDTGTGRPAHVAVDVFAATDPVRKHGVLRLAGEITESVLPDVKIEYVSVSNTLAPLLDAAERTSRALLARDIDVVSQHFVFLAVMKFPADDTTMADWVGLLRHARVTWIDFSTADRREPPAKMPDSRFGLHVLTDKEDVLTVVKKQSETLYQYAPEPLPDPPSPPDDEPPAGPPAEARRWWPFGKRPAE
jgi:hypothetical protein